MKNLFMVIMLSLVTTGTVFAQIDRSKVPEPGPAPKIQLGDYDKYTLDNGLKVIVVENRKMPMVSLHLAFEYDPVLEGDKTGYAEMTGNLLRHGTNSRSKEEIDEAIDFIGANLNTSSRSISANTLTKHMDHLMEIFSDVLLNPAFPQEEIDKLKMQEISGLASLKNSPDALAAINSAVLNYGKDHPYGEVKTEKTIENITREDLVTFYNSYFRPNCSYLVFVGDIDLAGAKKITEKYFSKWKKGAVPAHKYETPQPPAQPKVSFVDIPGGSQAVINVTWPVELKPGDENELKAVVLNTILGGGTFSGRLMQNLREDKAYTYGARSSLSTDKLIGSFKASASVRNEVTDSAITEFIYELERLLKEPVLEKELELVKNMNMGSFARGMEKPETIARYALNIEKYGLPEDYYKTYLQRLQKVTVQDLQGIAKNYIKPGNANILVVGNKDEVAGLLKKFAPKGQVYQYDFYGNPVKDVVKPVPEGVSASTVMKNYIEAIGGRKNLEKVQDMTTTMTLNMQGMALSVVQKKKKPAKLHLKINMGEAVLQEIKFDGLKGVEKGMQGAKNYEGEEANKFKKQALLFPELTFETSGYKTETLVIDEYEGKEVYKLVYVDESGEKLTDYFDVESGLKIRSMSSLKTPQGEIVQEIIYQDYKEVNKINIPHKLTQTIGPQVMNMEVTGVDINTGIPDEVFQVE